jgi:LuxR family maltose regulon positive regulatory protein
MWSQLNQCYELYLYGQAEQHFSAQDREAFSAWVRSQISFAFVGQSGRLSVLKEARERGSGYWYAYHKHGQHTHKGYLGPSEQLTFARLEELARKLKSPSPLPTRAIPISRREKAEQASKRMATAHPDQEKSLLLSTKFSPPRLPSFLVERADLRTSLQAVRTHALTLVSASAGSGKTTLLSADARFGFCWQWQDHSALDLVGDGSPLADPERREAHGSRERCRTGDGLALSGFPGQ